MGTTLTTRHIFPALRCSNVVTEITILALPGYMVLGLNVSSEESFGLRNRLAKEEGEC